jgi:predicted HicB family RNase H-like nuclease
MARPLNPEAGRFELQADPDEIRAWAAAAVAEDRSLASWLRRVANEAARPRKKSTGRAKKDQSQG